MFRKGPNSQRTGGDGLRNVTLVFAGALLAACTNPSANVDADQPGPKDKVSGSYSQAFGVNCAPDETDPKNIQIFQQKTEVDEKYNHTRATQLGVVCISAVDGSVEAPITFVALGDDVKAYSNFQAVIQVGAEGKTQGSLDTDPAIDYESRTILPTGESQATITVRSTTIKDLFLDNKDSDFDSPDISGIGE